MYVNADSLDLNATPLLCDQAQRPRGFCSVAGHLEEAGLLQVLHVAGVHLVAGRLLHQRRPPVEQHRHLAARHMTAPSAWQSCSMCTNDPDCGSAVRLWDGTVDMSVL